MSNTFLLAKRFLFHRVVNSVMQCNSNSTSNCPWTFFMNVAIEIERLLLCYFMSHRYKFTKVLFWQCLHRVWLTGFLSPTVQSRPSLGVDTNYCPNNREGAVGQPWACPCLEKTPTVGPWYIHGERGWYTKTSRAHHGRGVNVARPWTP